MPLIVDGFTKRWSPRRAARATALACLLLLAPAVALGDQQPPGYADAPPSTSACNDPYLSQPFLPLGDNRNYVLPSGETPGDFNGDGWTLTGGATVVQVADDSGAQHSVLDLPSGAMASSPAMCVTSAYPKARAMVRNVHGGDGVFFYVAYGGTETWVKPRNTGQIHGHDSKWTLSDPVDVQPDGKPGWQIVKFTFVGGGHGNEFQVYDFYVDPYAKR